MDVVLRIKELEKGHKLKAAATLWSESELLVNLFEKRTTATKILKDQRLSPAFNPTSSKPGGKYWVLFFFYPGDGTSAPLYCAEQTFRHNKSGE